MKEPLQLLVRLTARICQLIQIDSLRFHAAEDKSHLEDTIR